MRKIDRKKKIVLMVLVCLAAALAALGAWVYNGLFAHDDTVETQLVEQFGEDFFYKFDLDQALLPGDDTAPENEPGRAPAGDNRAGTEDETAGAPAGEDDTAPENEPSGAPAGDDQGGGQEAPQPAAPAPVTLEAIVAAYEPKFKALQALALERLEFLFNSAADEYKRQKREGTLNRMALTNKYIQAGKLLESSVDARFYSLLGELQAELSSNGFPTAITKEIESNYKKAKTAKKLELLGRLK